MSQLNEASLALYRLIVSYLDARYEENHSKHCKKIFESETFAHSGMHPNFKKVNEFASALMLKLGKEVYYAHRDSVHANIRKEVDALVKDLFTEEEATELLSFVKTQTGQKLLRNLDLIRDAYSDGMNILVTETVKAWSRPEIAELIMNYMADLDRDERSPEGDSHYE